MKGLVWFLAIAFLPAWIMWEAAIRLGVDPLGWRMQLFLVPGGRGGSGNLNSGDK